MDKKDRGAEFADNTAQLLQQASDASDLKNGVNDAEDESVVDELRELVDEQREVIDEQQQEIDTLRKDVAKLSRQVEKLRADVHGESSASTDLARYLQFNQEQRENLLSSTEQRAVSLVERWEEIAWKTPNGLAVETQTRANVKHSPSKLKYRIKQVLDHDLEWQQIYRMLKAVAKLSGGSPEHDEHGRMTIEGIRFSYYERTTADNNDTKRVLVEAEQHEF